MRRIFTYDDKLVEEVGYTTGVKVVFLKYLREDDMPKCKCGEPIDEEISIVEGCKNWQEKCKPVETIEDTKII